jgi:type I restriction enzyme S subunit
MREGWEIKTIAESTQIIAGGTPKTSIKEYWDGEIAWITPADLGKLTTREVDFTKRTITNVGLQKSSAKLFPAYSVILSSRAPIGHLAINTVPMATNQGCRGIVPNKNLDNTYLYYFIKTNIKLLNDLGTGTTFKELSTKALGSVNIPIPPLQEQQQIVAILDQAFEAIDQAKANIEKNIANAKELFQSKLNAIFSQKGDGWEEKSLGEVCDETKNIKWQDYPTQEFEYVDLSSVSRETLNITETATVNSKNAPSRARKLINLGDVIFATTRPTLRRATIIEEELSGHICSTGFVVLRPKKNISSDWIFLYLLTTTFMERMETLQRGASYPAVSDSDVKGSKLSIPTSAIVEKAIVLKMRKFQQEIDEIILQYQQKLNNLEDLKKSILQKAFAGALTNKEESVHLKQVAEPEARYSKK